MVTDERLNQLIHGFLHMREAAATLGFPPTMTVDVLEALEIMSELKAHRDHDRLQSPQA